MLFVFFFPKKGRKDEDSSSLATVSKVRICVASNKLPENLYCMGFPVDIQMHTKNFSILRLKNLFSILENHTHAQQQERESLSHYYKRSLKKTETKEPTKQLDGTMWTLSQCSSLNMLGPGSGTIRRCGLIGGCVSLWVQTLRPSSQQPRSQSSACFQNKMLFCSSCIMPAWSLPFSHLDDNGLNF